MKNVGVLLSGCGVFDGSEIHESVITLLLLQRNNVNLSFIAPNIDQSTVINHKENKLLAESRNVLIESSRITRGNIEDIKNVDLNTIHGLVIPGGAGVITNLCSFMTDGPECKVDKDVADLILNIAESKKPIGAICIAPVLIAKILKDKNVKVTIGNDQKISDAINMLGCTHINCSVSNIVYDESNKIVSTPAYMLAQNISEVYEGIETLINKFISLL